MSADEITRTLNTALYACLACCNKLTTSVYTAAIFHACKGLHTQKVALMHCTDIFEKVLVSGCTSAEDDKVC